MNYSISNIKRDLMIISAAFLTVYTIYNAFFFFGLEPGGVKPNTIMLIIRDLLFAIPHVYLLLVLFDYFRHQGWKILQYTLLLTVIMEILLKALNMINQIGSFVPYNIYYSMGEGLFWAVAIIVQAIFLLQIKRKDYPEVFSLQKYAVGLILTQIIGFGVPVIFRSENSSSMMLVIRTISAIPYLFLIDFTLKLKSKERMVSETRVNS
jgi:hypothetical protein